MQETKQILMSNVEFEIPKISRSITLPKLGPIKLELCLICIIALILSGCGDKSFPKLKVTHVYEADFDFQVCGKYKINEKTRKIEHVEDLPIEDCNGVTGFKPKDIPTFFDWVDDMIIWAKKKCS